MRPRDRPVRWFAALEETRGSSNFLLYLRLYPTQPTQKSIG
jgi:hypothetical protein